MNAFLLLSTTLDYKLSDLLSSAGATIGVIIAGTIFRSFLSSKYLELQSRYRSLTGEYRGGGNGESRHGMLQAQIRGYRRRLRLISRASWLSGVALLCFLASVLAGGLSMAWPESVAIKVIGTSGLLMGLVVIGVSVAIDLVEGFHGRHEIEEEAGDLDEPVRKSNC